MVVYKCDKCGDEGRDIDMRGQVGFSFGLYCASTTAYLKVNDSWVGPSENDKYHLCKKCVVEIVRQGEIESDG